MTAQAEGDHPGEHGASHTYENVTCPFCGLLCDDLTVTRTGSSLTVSNGCPRAVGGFQRPLPAAKPLVRDKEVSQQEAVAAAAALIRGAKLPLYGGMATDVSGCRAILSIADRTCGVLDHALSEGQYRNFRVVQTSGWIMSTLTETRNRADLIIIVGTDVHKLHGRFFDRIVTTPHTMFESIAGKRTVVFIGEGLDTSAATGPRVDEVIRSPSPRTESPRCCRPSRPACVVSPYPHPSRPRRRPRRAACFLPSCRAVARDKRRPGRTRSPA
jgi:formylmethanofuran dehydrogenase subunit B